jgi:tetratricopeptide (TPR) repeat protein
VGDDARALTFALRAAEAALAKHDDQAAGDLLRRAESARERGEAAGRPPDGRESARLLWLSGALSERRGRFAEATAPLFDAAGLARKTGDFAVAVDALTELSRARLGLGELGEAEERAREAALLAEAEGHRTRALTARILEAELLLRRGEPARGEALLDAVLSTIEPTDPRSVVSLAYRERAWHYVKRGAFADAEALAKKAHELARAAGDMLAQHHAIAALAAIRGESGDHLGALPLHLEALELSRRLSLRRREAIDLANLGEDELAIGLPEALPHFEEALRIFVEIGDRACEGDCSYNVGRALFAQGRLDEAERLLSFARERCVATVRHEYAGLSSSALAEVALARGNPAAALTHAADATATFHAIGSHHLWRALYVAARAAHAAGDRREAKTAILEATSCLDHLRSRLPRDADRSGFEREAAGVEATRLLLEG